MKQTTFIADGKTKIFHFTFPFFLKSDVIIEVDSQPATNYNLVCLKNGLNADVPFYGGQVQFARPPKLASVITIRRKLAVKRIVDYQPTGQYSPITHNQDMNYMVEVLKDMQTAVESVVVLPTDAANKNKIDEISAQIAQIISAIEELRGNPSQPGGTTVDLSEIYTRLDSLAGTINVLNIRMNELRNQIEDNDATVVPDGADFVIDSQQATAENNYTWYRKYQSGWVEQGGICPSLGYLVVFPVEMANANYTAQGTARETSGNYAIRIQNVTTTSFKMSSSATNNHQIWWHIAGMAAN